MSFSSVLGVKFVSMYVCQLLCVHIKLSKSAILLVLVICFSSFNGATVD